MIAAGPPITSVGGHCANMGGEAAGAAQLRAAVRERVERGADIVKVMASGGFATPGTEVMLCQFELDELREVVEAAHAAGLPVTAHAHGRPAVLMAMAAGVDGIEHCSFLTDKGPAQTDDDLDRLARAGTAVCPTLGFRGTPPAPPAGVALLAKLGMTFEQVAMMNKRRVAAMHAAGVRIVSGSDGGINAAKPHGLLPMSIAALVEGGVDTDAALASATSLAAHACGVGSSTGRLRAGYAADVLVVEGNVVEDIATLERPTAVFAAGHKVENSSVMPSNSAPVESLLTCDDRDFWGAADRNGSGPGRPLVSPRDRNCVARRSTPRAVRRFTAAPRPTPRMSCLRSVSSPIRESGT